MFTTPALVLLFVGTGYCLSHLQDLEESLHNEQVVNFRDVNKAFNTDHDNINDKINFDKRNENNDVDDDKREGLPKDNEEVNMEGRQVGLNSNGGEGDKTNHVTHTEENLEEDLRSANNFRFEIHQRSNQNEPFIGEEQEINDGNGHDEDKRSMDIEFDSPHTEDFQDITDDTEDVEGDNRSVDVESELQHNQNEPNEINDVQEGKRAQNDALESGANQDVNPDDLKKDDILEGDGQQKTLERSYQNDEKREKRKLLTKNLLPLTKTLKASFGGRILNFKAVTRSQQKRLSPYLFGQSIEKRAKVWKEMSKLQDMIAKANNQPVKKIKDITDIDGLIEDDIVLDEDDTKMLISFYQQNPSYLKTNGGVAPAYRATRDFEYAKRKIYTPNTSVKWTMPIRYKIKGPKVSKIKGAIKEWERETCIRFKETKSWLVVGQYLYFSDKYSGCWSQVGKKGGKQIISVPSPCSMGNTIHEIGHAIGFWHEQTRPDRDNYVNVYFDNIKSGKAGNFIRKPWSTTRTYGVPYDYSSVMHYGIYAFSKGGKTIEAKIPNYDGTLGQRFRLSFYDAKQANIHYCSSKCSGGLMWSKCKNGGYKNPNKCSECKCPDGFRGRYCQYVYYSSLCGSPYKTAYSSYRYLASPSYYTNKGYLYNTKCSWKITAPKGKHVRLEFLHSFKLRCHRPCRDYVEVRHRTYTLSNPGPRFCCSSLPRTFISTGNEMLINFRTNGVFKQTIQYKGFRARFKYVSWYYVHVGWNSA